MTVLPSGVPSLDRLSAEWVDAADLAHLHSLRNQWGQAHVNADLTSISWLAVPPYAGGYRTGVLRVDGSIPEAESFNWAPWGVRRRATVGGVLVETDTRLGYEATDAFQRVSATNETDASCEVELSLELLAPIAHSDVDWGWLHGVPWNDGHRHDYYAIERVRADAVSDATRQSHLVADDPRHIRLGRPRVPGIQRDEEDAPMLLETALPAHVSQDSPSRVRPSAVLAEFAWVEAQTGDVGDVGTASATAGPTRFDGPWRVDAPDDELRLPAVALGDGGRLTFEVRLRDSADGVLLTHGNHPDSLQFAIVAGCLVARVGGEPMRSTRHLEPGRRYRVSASVSSSGAALEVDGVEVARTSDWRAGTRWTASERGGAVVVVDSASPARSAFAFSRRPDRIEVAGQRGVATWSVRLAPGERVDLGVVLEFGDDEEQVLRRADWAARRFEARFASIAESWRRLWANAFTPGNPDHSGYLPVFESPDEGLELGYYYGILLVLYLRNTGVSPIGPVFLTGGPRLGATTTFYWDQSEWARIGAMLEPAGVRAWIVAALGQPYESSHSFDTRSLTPVGNHYSANDHALFTIVEHYVGITGDRSVLDESVRGRSVLDHLREMAGRARTDRVSFREGDAGVLVDLGRDAWELLECVPNYRDAVVSFNAGYAGMLRSLASLVKGLGETSEAHALRDDADRLTAAVLGQYAGDGRWRIAHPEGDDPIGHCLDFELVAAHLADELDERQRAEMVAFVEEHLLDGDWMRALSPDDPIAPFSDRPDHGAAGAFAGWPGSTSFGLARLGRPDLAAAFLSRIHRSRSGALWGQAVESIGGGRFRVAERGVSNRDSNAAVAVSEAVVGGLFGILAGFEHAGAGSLESEWGTLRNVRAVGFDLAADGAVVRREPASTLA
ncbi:hypothetical protein ET445_04225 [Agromyces protaetiae]|uniref:Uncharacterized protein n=1 Tax=Agromyces protaetiae TaxID=2509455 RepID=A0A4P6F949_9MICO|nr:hypothetical protein [Agromyces protaetiae]QAY72670.1 hypothetical protein ET445_04225 [Agromyces protaetiae]